MPNQPEKSKSGGFLRTLMFIFLGFVFLMAAFSGLFYWKRNSFTGSAFQLAFKKVIFGLLQNYNLEADNEYQQQLQQEADEEQARRNYIYKLERDANKAFARMVQKYQEACKTTDQQSYEEVQKQWKQNFATVFAKGNSLITKRKGQAPKAKWVTPQDFKEFLATVQQFAGPEQAPPTDEQQPPVDKQQDNGGTDNDNGGADSDNGGADSGNNADDSAK